MPSVVSSGQTSIAPPRDKTDIVPSATPTNQPVVPTASIGQRREIALKQEQDSLDSLFFFAIEISDDEGEEASSSQEIGISSAEVRAKLEDLLALLHQDTAQLVDDSDPAKALFKTLRGQIPADAEEILFRAAHLESRQL
ncbi:uncharacterized protein LOC110434924 [Sorghum bicolor]|uniref:uncharacterized protein LOC110434924 n=1 Tax=Sorghum bicolor TaxID=4558 RepID=UPI000B4236C1|nr:uncharacterized protein LOC110434924 [Sorghum bicolor]|eukprot:XP_021315604.1 uncharacterized protein LOC110434924 [Sorghum bicolor]